MVPCSQLSTSQWVLEPPVPMQLLTVVSGSSSTKTLSPLPSSAAILQKLSADAAVSDL